jgi:hypothetical protein
MTIPYPDPAYAMQKIRCPRCAVINLEKFVTFPRCAGCGGLLPGARSGSNAAPLAPVWRRPLAAVLWASVVGCVVMGLVVAVSMFEERPNAPGEIAINGPLRRSAQVDGLVTLQLTVDILERPTLQASRPLQNVRIRFPQDFFRKFRFMSLDPLPDDVVLQGRGHYFEYNSLPREAQLRLTVRARQAGTYELNAKVYAQGEKPGSYNARITVKPGPESNGRESGATSPSLQTPTSHISNSHTFRKR